MAGETSSEIQQLFSFLAPRYDLFNLLVSFGMDRGWRRKAADYVSDGSFVLDLCSGTGDLALEIARRNANNRIEALDFSPEMLEIGARKSRTIGLSDRIKWVTGRAEEIPFPEATFDFVTSSFALRNISAKLDMVISEIYRVLKEGGKTVALDLTRPSSPVPRFLYRLYLKYVMPVIGFLLYGKSAPFRYLGDSILDFYGVEEIKAKFKKAGFRECAYEPVAFGAAGIYIAVK